MDQVIIKSKKHWIGMLAAVTFMAGSAPMVCAQDESSGMPPRPGLTPLQQEQEARFQEGMKALDEDRLKSAIRAFSTILDVEPELNRAKLELALAHYRSMRYEQAQELAQSVLDDPTTPPEVRVTILAFLAQVKRDSERYGQKHDFNSYVAAGIMHDSNVNVGPTAAGLRVGDTDLTLAPGSTALSDNAYVGNAGFDHLYQSGRRVEVGERTGMLVWQSGASLYWRRYHEQNDYDLLVASVNTGPAVLMLREWRASLQLNSEYLTLGGEALGWFNSVNPSFTWQFDNGEINFDAIYTNRVYRQDVDSGLEGHYGAAGVTLGRYFNNRKVAATLGANAVTFSADDDQWSYTGGEVHGGFSAESWPDGTFYVRGRYADLYYEGDDPLFQKERHDKEYRSTVGITHLYTGEDDLLKDWVVNAFWERTFNDSNLSGLYTYKRYQMMLMLSRGF
ncbi:MAG: DUF560 domain-containing protein [Thiogranum sp.]|nr:DUF560 domain-containing protein [Thiogranum sp.]